MAIGGGQLRQGETLPIDRYLVERTGAQWPNLLFIPTASSDAEEYVQTVSDIYGGQLGCTVNVLRLTQNPPPFETIEHLVRAADLIYVGGGNTLKMMRLWRRLGVAQLLLDAHREGKVLAGLSAGALCWFQWGHSDSMSFYHPDDWDYIRVKGLGILPFTGCPHYDGEGRDQSFQTMIARNGGIGIAIDDCAAFEVEGDGYRILSTREGAGAYRVERMRGKVVQTSIPAQPAFQPLRVLL
ncbi:MAG: Type 1 glutamine amidotransferase-like domain-containing protein [Thermomicrobiales bacterium]|nr:Type 1 glutamine amidotransferase-like domain-containing protein [Thermomicrobiales bacterium]